MMESAITNAAPMPSPAEYGAAVVRVAQRYVGIRETSKNRGPEIDQMVRAVGLDPSQRHPWCMAAVYFWHVTAARELGCETTCPRTASATKSWQLAKRVGAITMLPEDVRSDAVTLTPGDQFVRVRLGAARDAAAVRAGLIRRGHTGIVERVGSDGVVHTIEGNTNHAGVREGDGGYRGTARLDAPELIGFVRWGGRPF